MDQENDKFKTISSDKLKKLKTMKQNKYMVKLLVIITTLNIVLTYMNIQKYFFDPESQLQHASLSQFRKNDQMNVALAARSYDQISDYFTAKSNLDNGYQIIKDGEIVPPKKDFPESLGYIKHIRIGYTDWNDSRAMEYIEYLKTNLKDKYTFELVQDNPDYLLFSFYGLNHRDNKYSKAIKIAVYEEGFIPSFNEEDYTFGVAHIFYLDRYFRKATLLAYLGDLKNKDFRKVRREVLKGKKREKFCAAVFSHERNEDHFREKFVVELSKYKKVDLGGEINNTVGYNVTNPVEFFSSYKFSIAFEKNSGDGYATGHIINSLLAGTIPIYYGDYLIDEYINPDTFILVRNDIDLMDKISYIKEVDKDDKLYREFFEKDVLIDENVVEKREKEEKDYWSHIFRPDKIDARRIDNIRYKTRKCYDWGKKMPK
jgi:hypothetical protein